MPQFHSLLGFVGAALVVLVIPGPGVLYIIARSLGQGQRAGLVSVLGLSTGALVHVVAATVGVSAILLTSATAFGLVKMLGAAYLIYLGIKAFLTKRTDPALDASSPRSMQRLFRDGVVISVLNPKIAVFFLAFLPQFADPSRGVVGLQILLLGILYVALALCTDGTYAFLASRLRGRIGSSVLQGPVPRYASGAVYMGLGLTAAFADRK